MAFGVTVRFFAWIISEKSGIVTLNKFIFSEAYI